LGGIASVTALAGDTVTVGGTASGSFANKTAGSAKAVTVSGITTSGTDAANYALTQPTDLTGSITQATQTITFNALAGKVVGDAGFSLTASASSGLPLTYASSNLSVATVSDIGFVTIVGAGTSDITVSQAGNSNYLPASQARTLTVTPQPLLSWEVSGLTGGSNNFGPTVLDGTYITNLNPNLTVVGLTRGSGILTTGTAASKGWGGGRFPRYNCCNCSCRQ
jgi:hypothetical protein